MISYGRQSINERDIKAVVDCLRAIPAQGPEVPSFEKTLAHLVQAEHAVAVNSGTSIHLACLALYREGDQVWTSPIAHLRALTRHFTAVLS